MDEPTSELWLPVVGYAGLYEVSDLGRVKSLPRAHSKGGILRPWLSTTGYWAVTLYRNGRARKPKIHQLVAAAFLGPCPPGGEVRHGPHGQLDNRASQLEYGTKKQNNGADKKRDGTQPLGERHPHANLTAELVTECRQRHAAGESVNHLARAYGVEVTALRPAVKGETWQHLAAPAVRLGRHRGIRSPSARLTDSVVLECRRRRAAGEQILVLAREYGVSPPTMRNALIGKTWKHVGAAADQ